MDYEIFSYKVQYKVNSRCITRVFGTEEGAITFIATNYKKWSSYRLFKILACTEFINELTLQRFTSIS